MTTLHPESHLASTVASVARRPRRPRFNASGLWPWIPGLLLASLIGTQIAVLASVLDDPTFATENDYYRKAVNWDSHMARERRSRALGWVAQPHVKASDPGASSLEVRLVDAAGQVVSGARVHGVAFHNARASRSLELALAEVSPGVYKGALGPVRPGLWELRLGAVRGADAYETTLRFELGPGGIQP